VAKEEELNSRCWIALVLVNAECRDVRLVEVGREGSDERCFVAL
jgi:hypothetical protein